jgi:hypothetical protein
VKWCGVNWHDLCEVILFWSSLKWSDYGEVLGDKSAMYIRVTLYWGYLIVLWLFHFGIFHIHMSVHRKYNSKLQPTRCNVSWFIYFYRLSTCFRRFLRPSSGAHNCTYIFKKRCILLVVICGCFGNMCTCIDCVLHCLYCVFCIVSFMYIHSYLFCLY